VSTSLFLNAVAISGTSASFGTLTFFVLYKVMWKLMEKAENPHVRRLPSVVRPVPGEASTDTGLQSFGRQDVWATDVWATNFFPNVHLGGKKLDVWATMTSRLGDKTFGRQK